MSSVLRLAPDPGATVSKAVIRAAEFLGISQAQVSAILGVSRATGSRLWAGSYLLSPERPKEFELALLFVRLFRSLDAITGHGEAARTWLTTENLALGGVPLELIKTASGLVNVVRYLDAHRGVV